MPYYAYVLFKDDDTYTVVETEDMPVVAKLRDDIKTLKLQLEETHAAALKLKEREESLEAETEYLKMKIKAARQSARELEHGLRNALPKNESRLSE